MKPANYPQPFTRLNGQFWDPKLPESKMIGSFWTYLGRPRIDVDGFTSQPNGWGQDAIHGLLEDGRQIVLVRGAFRVAGKVSPSHADEVQTYRFVGKAAFLGNEACSLNANTLLKAGICEMPVLAQLPKKTEDYVKVGTNFDVNGCAEKFDAVFHRIERAIRVKPGAPMKIEEGLAAFDKALLLAQKLLGTLTGVNAGANRYWILLEDGRKFEWIYSAWNEPELEPISTDALAAFWQIENPEKLLNNYLATQARYWPVADILYSTLPPKRGYAEHKFMTLAAALETIYFVQHGAPTKAKWTDEQSRKVAATKAKVEALCERSGDAEITKAFMNALKNVVPPRDYYAEKVRLAFLGLEPEIQEALHFDISVWSASVKALRNVTAHIGTTSTIGNTETENPFHYYDINESLRALIRQILLADMGVEASARWTCAMTDVSGLRQGNVVFMKTAGPSQQ